MNLVQMPEYAECLEDDSVRHFAFHGGRGSSKTNTVARHLILKAARKPCRVLCCREFQNSIKESVKADLEKTIEIAGLADFYTVTDTSIRGANGSLFIFAGIRTNINSIKSMSGITDCWVEEAQTISQASIDILLPTIREDGSQFYWTWNPKTPDDPVEKLFVVDDPPEGSIVKAVNWRDNPWFPERLAQQAKEMMERDPAKYAHVYEGAYEKRSDAIIFRNWRVEEFEAPDDAHFRFGADWGFSRDPTVLVRCYLKGRKLYIDHEVCRVGVPTLDLPDLFSQIPESSIYPIIADSSRPETIDHMQKHGFPKMRSSVKGKDSVMEGIEWLQSMDIVVHPRCQNAIRELGSYSWQIERGTEAIISKPADKDNHVIDALRYACEAARKIAMVERPVIVPRPIASRF